MVGGRNLEDTLEGGETSNKKFYSYDSSPGEARGPLR